MARFRRAESYYGRTAQARKRQKMNLTPGNAWDRKHRKELKLDCWWWTLPLGNMREIYEPYENQRDIENTPGGELKDEIFLDEWWKGLTIEDKEFIIKTCKGIYKDKDEEEHKKNIYKCLEEKIKEEAEAGLV